MRRRLSRRAGLTLIEVIIVSSFAAIFAVFLAGTIVTSTTMNRDTYVENEVVDLANRAADEVASALSGAGRFTDAWDLSELGDQLEFQDTTFTAANARQFGVTLPGQTVGVPNFGVNGVKRLVFVAERTFNEATGFNAPVDINGDGDQSDTAVVVGRLELRTYLIANPAFIEQTGLRRTYGGGSTRFCQRPLDQPIFGRTPHTSWTANVPPAPPTLRIWASRAGQIVRTEDDVNTVVTPLTNHDPLDIDGDPTIQIGETAFGAGRTPFTYYRAPVTGFMDARVDDGGPVDPLDTDPSPPPITQPDTAVRLNLRVVYNPTPDARGRAEVHAFSLVRTVTLQ